MMEKRPLGSTGLLVSPIGFGTSPLGSMPGTYGYEVDEQRAVETLHAIFDSPVNLIDTSRNYGFGRSEERVGAALRSYEKPIDHLVLSTKVDRDMETLRFDASRVRQSFEESLDALGVDRVDILHLHDPEYGRDIDEITTSGGAIDEVFKIRDEGLARCVGLAMGQVDLMFDLLRRFRFDVALNHNRFTALNRQADALFQYAGEQGMGILNAAPYAGGVLAKGSTASTMVTYQEATSEAMAPVQALEELCADHGVPLGAVALQFSMRDARIASTILGVSKPERVTQSIEWATTPIPDGFWAAFDALPYSTDDPEANRVYSPD
jgi:D-threo-aldose 1-dehydrogenase